MVLYEFDDFYYDFYDKNIEEDRLDTIIYEGTSPTIVITHSFLSDDDNPTTIKLYYYVSNKTGSITLKNIYDAINAQTGDYKKLYNTQNLKRLYIEDFIPVNSITFNLLTFGYNDAVETIKYVTNWTEAVDDTYWVVADINGSFES